MSQIYVDPQSGRRYQVGPDGLSRWVDEGPPSAWLTQQNPAPQQYPAEQYAAPQPYPTVQQYPAEQYAATQQYPPARQYPAEQYAATQQYPTAQGYPGSQPYPGTQQYPTAQPHPGTQQYPTAQRYPTAQNAADQRFAAARPPGRRHTARTVILSIVGLFAAIVVIGVVVAVTRGSAADPMTTSTPVATAKAKAPAQAREKAKASAPAPAHSLGEDQGWVLVSIVPHLDYGILTADARVTNNSDATTATVSVSYLDANGNVTHEFDGAIDNVAKGRTVTVELLGAAGRTLPKGKPDFRVTAAF